MIWCKINFVTKLHATSIKFSKLSFSTLYLKYFDLIFQLIFKVFIPFIFLLALTRSLSLCMTNLCAFHVILNLHYTYAHLAKKNFSYRSRQIFISSCGKNAKLEIFLRMEVKNFSMFLMREIILLAHLIIKENFMKDFSFSHGITWELSGSV